ncbi:hypothetical protein K8R78_06460 [bacterium]|nr:hypothetical protein [bacterium]
MDYIPLILAGLLAVAAVIAHSKAKSTSFLFIMLGFVIQFLLMILPMIGVFITFTAYLNWIAYALILIGLLMVKKD